MAQVKEYDVLTFDEQHVDVSRCIREHTDGCGVQVAVDTTGTPQVLDNVVDWLMPRGTLVLHRLPIHQVHHGFELMRSRKDDVIKVAIVFDG